jgi:flavin reductase (DIM6/NTAB) family NADH-FMN oxidoreductase RutF
MTAGDNVFNWMPCPVVFICTHHAEQRDIMTATAMFVSEKEPLVTVSVAQGRLTDHLMTASGRFTLAIAAASQRQLAIQLGSTRGDQVDKYSRFDIRTLPEDQGMGLVPEAAAAWMMCRVEDRQAIHGYHVVTGRVEDQGDLDRDPLIWRQGRFFATVPVA